MRASSQCTPSRAEAGVALCALAPRPAGEAIQGRCSAASRSACSESLSCNCAVSWPVWCWLLRSFSYARHPRETCFAGPQRSSTPRPSAWAIGLPKRGTASGKRRSACVPACPCKLKNVPIFAQSDLLRTVSLSARTTPNHRVVTPSHKPVQCRRCDKAWGDRLKRLLESGLVSIFNFTRSSHVHAICA
jgi:hypothetical protein